MGNQRLRSLGQALATVVLLGGLVAGASALHNSVPTPAQVMRTPFVHAADLGQSVSLRSYDVRVSDAQLARSVEKLGKKFLTSEVFLVADIELTSSERELGAVYAVGADGKHYGPTHRLLECADQFDVWVKKCTVVIEVPKDGVKGMKLAVGAGVTTHHEALDDIAVIGLESGEKALPISQIYEVESRF